MLFVIHCLDRDDGAELRASLAPAHAQYIRQHVAQVVLGGPLLSDDGSRRIGILVVADFDGPEAAQAFVAQEPYHQGGLFTSVSITRLHLVDHQDPQRLATSRG